MCGARIDLTVPGQCPACAEMHYLNSRPTGGAVVERDAMVLLARRAIAPWLGAWDIPGGFCDGPEHPRDAAKREVFEEVGLEVEMGEFIGMWVDGYELPSGITFDTLNSYFRAICLDHADPKLDPDECSEYQWFSRDDLPLDDIAFPDQQIPALQAWLEMTSTPDQVV